MPKWNEWDHTLPLFLFRAASPILSSSGFLIVLYSGDLLHVGDVLDACCSTGVVRPVGTWSTILNTPMYQAGREEMVRLYFNFTCAVSLLAPALAICRSQLTHFSTCFPPNSYSSDGCLL